jgi:hypothetical protein
MSSMPPTDPTPGTGAPAGSTGSMGGGSGSTSGPGSMGGGPRGTEWRPPIGMGFFPGNAELVVWILALVVAMLVTWIADTLGSGDWYQFFVFSTVAYLLSRGIAKASRVYEV